MVQPSLNPESSGEPIADDPAVRLDRLLGAEYDGFGDRGIASSDELLVVTNGTDRLEAFDAAGEPIWSTTLGDDLESKPVIDDGTVYVAISGETFSSDQLVALDASDGSLQWNSFDTAGVELYSDVPPVFGEYLYVFDPGDVFEPDDGESVYALDPSDGSIVWEQALDDTGHVQLAADDDAVYVVDDDHVRAFGGSSGDVLWNRGDWPLSGEVSAQPTIADGTLYVTADVDDTGALYAFDTADGVPLWRTPIPEEADLSPVVWNNGVFVASGSSIHGFDSLTGERNAMYQTAGEIQALELGAQLYVASKDPREYSGPGESLTALEHDLSVAWATSLPTMTGNLDRVAYPTALATIGDTLYVAGISEEFGTPEDNSLYVFEPTTLTVDDVEVVEDSATVGETITVEATVSNHGEQSETSEVTFEIDSPLTPTYLDHRTTEVSVGAGETTTTTLELEVTSSGTYEITAFESGTGGLASDPRVESVSVVVGHENPDDDWTQIGYDAAGSHWNPNTHAPTKPLMQTWEFETDGNVERNPVLVKDDTVVVHNDTTVFGLDLETGNQLWDYRISVPEEADDTEEIGSHVIVDDVVYFGMSYSVGHAGAEPRSRLYTIGLDDGELIDYRHFEDQRINLRSLSTDGDSLFFTMRVEDNGDNHGDRYLWAVDRHDFSNQKSQYFADDSEFNSGDQVLVTGDRLAIADRSYDTGSDTIRTFDRSTLELTASRTFDDGDIRTLITDGETIYLSLEPDEGGVYQLLALDPDDLSTTWQLAPEMYLQQEDKYDQHHGLVVSDSMLITATRGPFTSDHIAHYGIDTERGEVEWFESTNKQFETRLSQSPIVAADGVFYAGLKTYDAATGEHISFSKTGHPVAISNGTVLSVTDDGIGAYQGVEPISVSELELSATELEHGEELEATVVVTNPTPFAQPIRVDMTGANPLLRKDGSSGDYTTTLGPSESETITFSVTPHPGDHSIHADISANSMFSAGSPNGYYRYHTTAPQTATVYGEPIEPTELEGVVLTDAELSTDSAMLGEPFTVEATLQNLGTESVTESIEVAVGSDSTDTSVTIGGGASETIEVTLRGSDEGDDQTVTVNGIAIGTVHVIETDLWLANLDADSNTVGTGETVTITAALENRYYPYELATSDLGLWIDGEIVQTKHVEVPPYYEDDYGAKEVTFEQTFDSPGEFEVLVTGDGVSIDVNPVTVDVELEPGSPPVAAFDYEPTEPEVGDEVTFDASASSAPEGTIAAYRWDFTGDGTVDVTTTEPEATWTYDEAGDYSVTLEVEDDTGETAETTETVAVTEPEPSVADYADAEDGVVRTDGLRDAIDDWRDDDVDTDLLRAVIDAWRSGEQVD
ncbi:PQQ-binding-like beta-propeller repeat protein [Natronobeatus ordinarius]|uniref:outer membrane protein assembly factor BamB family protein n=1 Tax=Natronobeatus ordinarius TaxID=2963433 RepID=UPI0020CD3675|nr:PQQ-binding-like beta-propeller repeat protein [Natronobeatus ordinarius]